MSAGASESNVDRIGDVASSGIGGFAMRSALPAERPTVLEWLPEVARAWRSDRPEPALAVVSQADRVVGAIALSPELIGTRPPSLAVALRAAPGQDPGTVEPMLVRAAEVVAGGWRTYALCSWSGIEPDSAEARRWERLGFERRPKSLYFKTALSDYERLLAPICARLTAHGRIPDDVEALPLAKAPLSEVMHLRIQHLGGRSETLLRRLRGNGRQPFHRELSTVLMRGGRVCGFMLCRIDHEGAALVDSKVVASSFRRGWANVILMWSTIQAARRIGLELVHFQVGDRHEDTRRLARRAGAVALQRFVRVMRM